MQRADAASAAGLRTRGGRQEASKAGVVVDDQMKASERGIKQRVLETSARC